MSRLICLGTLICHLIILTGCECMDQYNPRPYWSKLDQERKIAHNQPPRLTSQGKIPEPLPLEDAEQLSQVDKNYKTFCASCHGIGGKGDTPVAQALNPQPRDFSSADWQNSVTDSHIAKVLKEGGAANGLSPSMAAWGSVMSDDEITEMVKKIRAFVN